MIRTSGSNVRIHRSRSSIWLLRACVHACGGRHVSVRVLPNTGQIDAQLHLMHLPMAHETHQKRGGFGGQGSGFGGSGVGRERARHYKDRPISLFRLVRIRSADNVRQRPFGHFRYGRDSGLLARWLRLLAWGLLACLLRALGARRLHRTLRLHRQLVARAPVHSPGTCLWQVPG